MIAKDGLRMVAKAIQQRIIVEVLVSYKELEPYSPVLRRKEKLRFKYTSLNLISTVHS